MENYFYSICASQFYFAFEFSILLLKLKHSTTTKALNILKVTEHDSSDKVFLPLKVCVSESCHFKFRLFFNCYTYQYEIELVQSKRSNDTVSRLKIGP